MWVNLGQAVGTQVRRLREEAHISQDALARSCRRVGMGEWTAARIAAIERGVVAPTPDVLYVLASAFAHLRDRPIALGDLLPPGETVQVGKGLAVNTDVLRRHLDGPPVAPPASDYTRLPDLTLRPEWGAADDKAVAVLGLEPPIVLAAAKQLWGPDASVTTERDRRAGPDASAQKRGRITRTLLADLLAEAERMGAEEAAADGQPPLPG